MKYKVGDRVKYGSEICTVTKILENQGKFKYRVQSDTWFDIVNEDEMIEGLVEEETKNNNDMEEKETLLGWVKENDSLRLVPHKDYEIKHDGDNFYLVKKKKEYPKTYEECCKVMNYCCNPVATKTTHKEELIRKFQFLLLYRDAYWKIAGEEMGLGKPWESDNDYSSPPKYIISCYFGDIIKEKYCGQYNRLFSFPTEEMRDVFYENFKELIESCKELL